MDHIILSTEIWVDVNDENHMLLVTLSIPTIILETGKVSYLQKG